MKYGIVLSILLYIIPGNICARENNWERYNLVKYQEWQAEESVNKEYNVKSCSVMTLIGRNKPKTSQVFFIIAPASKIIHQGKFRNMEAMLAGDGYVRFNFKVKTSMDVYGIGNGMIGNDFNDFLTTLKTEPSIKIQWNDNKNILSRETISMDGFVAAIHHCVDYTNN